MGRHIVKDGSECLLTIETSSSMLTGFSAGLATRNMRTRYEIFKNARACLLYTHITYTHTHTDGDIGLPISKINSTTMIKLWYWLSTELIESSFFYRAVFRAGGDNPWIKRVPLEVSDGRGMTSDPRMIRGHSAFLKEKEPFQDYDD